MYFEQFYLGCLAHASYLLGSHGEAIVVDPQRDVEIYLKAAQDQNLVIRHIFETHLHADFVSGHRELAARTGATIYVGGEAHAEFPHVPLHQGFELNAGGIWVQCLETPGHTPESVCLLIWDQPNATAPWGVLTGDTLFIGDVGRPDLSPRYTSAQLAGMLYDSLFEKLLKLPDATRVYPAHGAGSLCGRNMRAERSSTIGNERLTNAALQAANRDEFVRQVTANLPARPGYFSQDAEINRAGAVPLGELPAPKEIAPAELEKLLKQGVIGLDVRPTDQFAESHIPGSVNIALSGQFASWAATLFGLGSRPILIAETEEQYAEARTRLARVGIEDLEGRLAGGVKAWINAGLPVERLEQMTVQQLEEKRRTSNLNVLDVRREPEWESGHIAGANWWPLDNFRVSPPEIEQSVEVAVHCKGGYRSMIACSLLQRAGYKNVINVVGGFDAWLQEKLPVETGVGASV
jgi:glyoxylase-like metal-dependent hydrolase (beta-lactamase superfamily II)/rhodanese-related sulfurtransferase